jgi:hypothetical protein
MNKHLLLALIAIPLIAGCEANGSSSTQAGAPVDDSVASDIGEASVDDSVASDIGEASVDDSVASDIEEAPGDDTTPDSSDPNFSVVVNTAPEGSATMAFVELTNEHFENPTPEYNDTCYLEVEVPETSMLIMCEGSGCDPKDDWNDGPKLVESDGVLVLRTTNYTMNCLTGVYPFEYRALIAY